MSTQDELVEMVRRGIRSKYDKEERLQSAGSAERARIDDIASAERDRLNRKADEIRSNLERAEQLSKARRDLAFGSAQADANQQFDALEAELQESRRKMEADRVELDDFEASLMRSRQYGLPFKSLYAQPAVERRLYARHSDGCAQPKVSSSKERGGDKDGTAWVKRRFLPLALAALSLGACASGMTIGSSKTWQALLCMAMVSAVLLTITAEQVASRDIRKEMEQIRAARQSEVDDTL